MSTQDATIELRYQYLTAAPLPLPLAAASAALAGTAADGPAAPAAAETLVDASAP